MFINSNLSNILDYTNKLSRKVLVFTLLPIAFIMCLLGLFFVERNIAGEQVRLITGIQENIVSAVQIGDTFQLKKLAHSLVNSTVLSGLKIKAGDNTLVYTGRIESVISDSYFFPNLYISSGLLISTRRILIPSTVFGQEITIYSSKEVPLWSIIFIANALIFSFVSCAFIMHFSLRRMALKICIPIQDVANYVSDDKENSDESFDLEKNFEFSEIQDIFTKHKYMLKKTKGYLSDLSRLRVAEAIAKTTQMVAHDVRKPFSMVKMMMDMIEDANSSQEIKEISHDFLPEIRAAISSVSGMLQDIMEVGAETNLTQEEANPATLIESTLNEVIRNYRDSEVYIFYELNHVHMVYVDTLKIQRVLSNILGNALEAMKFKGSLWFKTRQIKSIDKNIIEFCLGNDGSFIDNESLEKLFEAFFTKDKKGGTGLGLAIAQKIVESHGGKIWCTSEVSELYPTGKVEFWFTLPATEKPCGKSNDVILPRNSSEILNRLKSARKTTEVNQIQEEEYLFSSEKVILDFLQKSNKKMTILIVDDEAVYRNALRSLIEKSQNISSYFNIFLAENGEEAIGVFREHSPDICILDIDLQHQSTNGFDILKTIRALSSSSQICIHSNRTGTKFQKQAMDFGANAFLPKPMSRNYLMGFIAESITQKKVESAGQIGKNASIMNLHV